MRVKLLPAKDDGQICIYSECVLVEGYCTIYIYIYMYGSPYMNISIQGYIYIIHIEKYLFIYPNIIIYAAALHTVCPYP